VADKFHSFRSPIIPSQTAIGEVTAPMLHLFLISRQVTLLIAFRMACAAAYRNQFSGDFS
jgi:hypothetical protein